MKADENEEFTQVSVWASDLQKVGNRLIQPIIPFLT